jgi:hypothetical protein
MLQTYNIVAVSDPQYPGTCNITASYNLYQITIGPNPTTTPINGNVTDACKTTFSFNFNPVLYTYRFEAHPSTTLATTYQTDLINLTTYMFTAATDSAIPTFPYTSLIAA